MAKRMFGRKPSKEEFNAAVGDLERALERATTSGPDGTARFMNFEVPTWVRDNVHAAVSLYQDGDVEGAIQTLQETFKNLLNVQKKYFAGSVPHYFELELDRLLEEAKEIQISNKNKIVEGWVARIRKKLDAINTMASKALFTEDELDSATTLYWATVDTVNQCFAELNNKRQKWAEKKSVDDEAKQAAQAEASRAAQREYEARAAEERAREAEEAKGRLGKFFATIAV